MVTTLYGKDTFAVWQRRHELLRDAAVIRLGPEEGVGAMVAAIGQSDLFGESPAVLISNPFALSAAEQKSLAAHIKSSLSSDQSIVVEAGEKLPKGVLCEVLRAGKAEEFSQPTTGQLQSWVQQEASTRGVEVQKRVVPQFIDLFGGSKFAMASELDRLRWERPARLDERALVTIQFVGGETDMFGVTDWWGQRQQKAVLAGLMRLWQQQTAVQLVVAMLERQARLLLLVCQSQDSGESIDALNLHPYVLSKLSRAAKGWSVGALMKALEQLYTADVAIKKGLIDPQLAVERWVVQTTGER